MYRRWFVALSVATYALVLAGLVRARPSPAGAPGDCIAGGFPPVWNGMTLKAHTAGDAALAALDSHHGRPLQLAGAQMARYEGEDADLTVWVAVAGDPGEAWDLVDRMTRKISSAAGRLSPPVALHLGDLVIHKAIGGEWQHFYYVRGDRVYWLAIRSPEADRLALEAARAF